MRPLDSSRKPKRDAYQTMHAHRRNTILSDIRVFQRAKTKQKKNPHEQMKKIMERERYTLE